MRSAALGTTAFFFLAPGTVAGLVPGLLSGWDRPAGGLRVTDGIGAGLVVIGLLLVFTFVTTYEQPTLRHAYGAHYEAYCRAVPGWWPRLTPWRG